MRCEKSRCAICLRIAFLSGSLVFTDTLGRSFDQIAYGTVTDATVRPLAEGTDAMTSSYNRDTRSIPASVVRQITELPEVEQAQGAITGTGQLEYCCAG